jgi:hypothetical protein
VLMVEAEGGGAAGRPPPPPRPRDGRSRACGR